MPKTLQTEPAGMIIRQKEPANLETPLGEVDSYVTPTELFYIRSHFTAPPIDQASYRLRVDGAVRKPLSLTLEQLRQMPSETRTVTLECAGNGRVFLVPQVSGAQWGLGAVGNAEWRGVPLHVLLERAGIAEDVCEIVLEGADRGTPNHHPIPPEPISYARSLLRAKAMQDEVLIAYEMNGRELPLNHGYPMRAIVPGHYGMASVKWLTRIEAVREPFRGYWQTTDYAYWDRLEGKPVRRALAEMQVKSEIIRPRVYETLPPNERYTILGMAWAGETEVVRISVSTDNGQSWSEGEFLDPARRHAWRRWAFEWVTPERAGPYTLMSRATAADGSVQPDKHDANYGTYVINYPLPIVVFVDGGFDTEQESS
jgi:DMSO/TMAO reductase YedYZ molybdopterin-dependent catalytic subunit